MDKRGKQDSDTILWVIAVLVLLILFVLIIDFALEYRSPDIDLAPAASNGLTITSPQLSAQQYCVVVHSNCLNLINECNNGNSNACSQAAHCRRVYYDFYVSSGNCPSVLSTLPEITSPDFVGPTQ